MKLKTCKALMLSFLLIMIGNQLIISDAEAVKLPSIVTEGAKADEVLEEGFSELKEKAIMFVMGMAVIAFIFIGNLYFQGEHEMAIQRGKQVMYGLLVIALSSYIVNFAGTLMG